MKNRSLSKKMRRVFPVLVAVVIMFAGVKIPYIPSIQFNVQAVDVFTTYNLTETELKKIASLCQQEQGTAKGAAAEASLMANRFEMYGSKYSSVYDYARNSGWFAKAGTYMDKMNATDAVVEAVRNVLINGKRTIPGYIDEHDCFSDLKSCTNNGVSITIKDRSQYKQFVTIINNVYGSKYTFYCFPTSSSDPFGYISETKRSQIGEAYYDYDTGELINGTNPPTYSNLTANKTIIAIGEEITFTASSDYATGFTIGIDNETSRYLTQEMPNGQLTLTFDNPGNYGAYVTSYNSVGYADSSWISFTVYDKIPTYSNLTANKTMIAVGEEITFSASSDYATGFTIGIDDEVERYLTQGMENGKLTLSFNKAGKYGAYVTSYNSIGYADSQWIGFTVYDSSPTYSKLTANKTMISVEEEITFTASSDYASEYWIGIDNKDGRYLTKNMPDGYLSVTFDKPGEYSAYVTSSNKFGGKDSTLIKFVVFSSSPTYSKLTADKTAIAVGEKIKFTASSDYASEYWIGIDNKDGRYLTQNMPDGCLSVTFDKPGEYSAYVTSSNKFGGKDSVLIKFIVFSSIEGDVNNDDKLTIADAVLLQEWILAVPNVTLPNWKAADLFEDGRLDVFDFCLLKKMLIDK